MLVINIKKINPEAITPEFAYGKASGFDLYTSEELVLKPKEKGIAKTGLIFELVEPWGIQIKPKSGITIKGVPTKDGNKDITVYEGTIDMDYRGELGIMVKNEEDHAITIPKHTKLAQGVLRKVYQCKFKEVSEVNLTDRGSGGFGSTGTTIKSEQ